MKKLKVIGVVTGSLILLLVGFYFMFLVPVQPEVVCENMFKVAKNHLTDNGLNVTDKEVEELVGMNKARCIKKTGFNYRNTTQSFLKVTSHSKCVANAENWTALRQCSNGG